MTEDGCSWNSVEQEISFSWQWVLPHLPPGFALLAVATSCQQLAKKQNGQMCQLLAVSVCDGDSYSVRVRTPGITL